MVTKCYLRNIAKSTTPPFLRYLILSQRKGGVKYFLAGPEKTLKNYGRAL